MERCGADAVVAEGCESGGHIGETTTMVLVPQVVDAVNIPVIELVESQTEEDCSSLQCWCKSRSDGNSFVATTECWAHQNYKDMY